MPVVTTEGCIVWYDSCSIKGNDKYTHNMNKISLIAINKWVYFCMNYPYNFIEQVWAGDTNMINHLKSKFNGYYEDYGSRAVMNTFYCNLDGNHQQRLMAWVMDNFNDEQKLRFND